jgi:hypothetical protein
MIAVKAINFMTDSAVGGRIQRWKVIVCLGIALYFGLAATTHTIRFYHWLILLIIPAVLLAAERGQRFFFDWSPLFAFWLAYDCLRLLQPTMLSRVFVSGPFSIEQSLFGWIGGDGIPAHSAKSWLAVHATNPFWSGFQFIEQIVYLSHLFLFPAVLVFLWVMGIQDAGRRQQFVSFMSGLTILNVLGILGYVLVPTAPPWWVSIHGPLQPTLALIAQTDVAMGMDGPIIRHMIATAPQWFAAIPSMHGAYPLLLLFLGQRYRFQKSILLMIAGYGALMWTATVVLNQHYIIDLLIGGALAVFAFLIFTTSFVQRKVSTNAL